MLLPGSSAHASPDNGTRASHPCLVSHGSSCLSRLAALVAPKATPHARWLVPQPSDTSRALDHSPLHVCLGVVRIMIQMFFYDSFEPLINFSSKINRNKAWSKYDPIFKFYSVKFRVHYHLYVCLTFHWMRIWDHCTSRFTYAGASLAPCRLYARTGLQIYRASNYTWQYFYRVIKKRANFSLILIRAACKGQAPS
jgi:hypothetical protein